jgi:hypothetical protein
MVFAGSGEEWKRGRSAVVVVEIHIALSALPPFMFIRFGRRKKNKNTGGRGNGN